MIKHKTIEEIDKCVDEIIDVINWVKYGEDTKEKKDLLWKLSKMHNDLSTSVFNEYYAFNHKINSRLDILNIPNELYVYQTLNCDKRDSIICCLKNELLHLRDVKNDINDSKEFNILILKSIEELKRKHKDDGILLNDYEKLRDNFIINCLTSNSPISNDSKTKHMWDEYGRNESAVCIEIDMNDERNSHLKDYMKKVIYVDDKSYTDQLVYKIHNLDIGKYRKNILKDLFIANLYTKLKKDVDNNGKSQNWEQENEYRIIIGYGNGDFYTNKKINYAPSKIYYKKQMPSEDKKVLRKLSGKIHVEIEEIE